MSQQSTDWSIDIPGPSSFVNNVSSPTGTFETMGAFGSPSVFEVGDGSNYSSSAEITESRAIRQFRLKEQELRRLQPVSSTPTSVGVVRKYRTQDVLSLRAQIIQRAMEEDIDDDKEIPTHGGTKFIFETEARNKYNLTRDDLKTLHSYTVGVDKAEQSARFYAERDIRNLIRSCQHDNAVCVGILSHGSKQPPHGYCVN